MFSCSCTKRKCSLLMFMRKRFCVFGGRQASFVFAFSLSPPPSLLPESFILGPVADLITIKANTHFYFRFVFIQRAPRTGGEAALRPQQAIFWERCHGPCSHTPAFEPALKTAMALRTAWEHAGILMACVTDHDSAVKQRPLCPAVQGSIQPRSIWPSLCGAKHDLGGWVVVFFICFVVFFLWWGDLCTLLCTACLLWSSKLQRQIDPPAVGKQGWLWSRFLDRRTELQRWWMAVSWESLLWHGAARGNRGELILCSLADLQAPCLSTSPAAVACPSAFRVREKASWRLMASFPPASLLLSSSQLCKRNLLLGSELGGQRGFRERKGLKRAHCCCSRQHTKCAALCWDADREELCFGKYYGCKRCKLQVCWAFLLFECNQELWGKQFDCSESGCLPAQK